jgi:hypothetical protein
MITYSLFHDDYTLAFEENRDAALGAAYLESLARNCAPIIVYTETFTGGVTHVAPFATITASENAP